jgi:hypothetical protein
MMDQVQKPSNSELGCFVLTGTLDVSSSSISFHPSLTSTFVVPYLPSSSFDNMKRRCVFVSISFMMQVTSSNIGMEPDYIFQGFSYFHQSVKKNNGISLQNGPLSLAFTHSLPRNHIIRHHISFRADKAQQNKEYPATTNESILRSVYLSFAISFAVKVKSTE